MFLLLWIIHRWFWSYFLGKIVDTILMIKGCSLVISVSPGYLQCFNIFLSFLFLCFLVMEIETLHNKIRSRKLFDFAFFYITNGFNYNFVRLPQASVDRLGKSV